MWRNEFGNKPKLIKKDEEPMSGYQKLTDETDKENLLNTIRMLEFSINNLTFLKLNVHDMALAKTYLGYIKNIITNTKTKKQIEKEEEEIDHSPGPGYMVT